MVVRVERNGAIRRRYVVIACVGFLIFLFGYVSKGRGRVSFLEGTIILVTFIGLVTAIAYVADKVRNPGA